MVFRPPSRAFLCLLQVMVPVQDAFANPLPPLPASGSGSRGTPPPPPTAPLQELVTIVGMEDTILVRGADRGGG